MDFNVDFAHYYKSLVVKVGGGEKCLLQLVS